jgi:hypothetical protein
VLEHDLFTEVVHYLSVPGIAQIIEEFPALGLKC